MAKEEKKPSLSDFDADDSLFDTVDDTDEIEESEVEAEEEVEEQEEKPVDKKKKSTKKDKPTEIVEDPKKDKKPKEESTEDIVEEEVEETESEEEEVVEDATKFFEEVGKITGYEVDVVYGDVDPLTPQGIAIREKVVREAALNGFLEEMEEKFPLAYKALQHSYNGGDVAELFTQTTGRDYSTVTLNEGDDAVAKEILKEYYKARGVKNEAKILKMIEADEDSEGGLLAEAKTALEELKGEQEEKRNELIETQKQKAAEQKKRDQLLVTAFDEVIETAKLDDFKITDRKEASEFKKFVLSSIRKTVDGKYELATPIDPSNLEKLLKVEYFRFKKGDLSKIITQKAQTLNTQKLSLKLRSEQQKQKKTTEQEQRLTPSMKDYES